MAEDLITGVRFMAAFSMIFIALLLAMIHHGKVQSRIYSFSRWLVCLGALLIGLQMAAQFVGHFRESNVGLSWILNLMCYVIVIPAFNLGELNLLRAGHNMNSPMRDTVGFIIGCIVLFCFGYVTDTLIDNDSPHQTISCAIAILLTVKIVHLSWRLHREMRIADMRLNESELQDRLQVLRYTALSMKCLLAISFLSPWIGMFSNLTLQSVFGIVTVGLLIWFTGSFVLYGLNVSEVIEVSDQIHEATMLETCPLPVEDVSHVNVCVERWVASRQFTNPNISITDALSQMGITAQSLNYYLLHEADISSYRKWIPYLRIEEAKKMMRENPNYTLDAIAEQVGLSNGSALSRAFKTQTGITPTEWIKKHVQTDGL